MAIVQKWQHINIRSLWLHIIIGVIAAGSGLSASVSASPSTHQTILLTAIDNSIERTPTYQGTIVLAKKKDVNSAILFTSKFNQIHYSNVNHPQLGVGCWLASVIGTRAGPDFFI